ncbi:hypothetical protein T265_00658 [Opisthorchis viverrini]|uniref:Uncharacterized protein n=1 Tax=Opisthorchis viverrini TaxID=6198 RepID=A0A075A5H2_OPIVI|nr:hypothetical protein T265_00658 [Opisthorchis viverrini]KER33552.1 hypothetical protein T265_00658 [Opisthorchis viverrini]
MERLQSNCQARRTDQQSVIDVFNKLSMFVTMPVTTKLLPDGVTLKTVQITISERLQSNCQARRTDQQSVIDVFNKLSMFVTMPVTTKLLPDGVTLKTVQIAAGLVFHCTTASLKSSPISYSNRSAVTSFRCLAATSDDGSTRAEILSGCRSLDRTSRYVMV